MVNICRHIILTFRNLNNLTNLRFKPWDIKASSRSWAELEVPVFQPLELISEYLHSCTAIKDVCQNLQGPQVVHSVLACSQENIFSVYQHFQDLYHSNSIVRTISLDSPSYPAPLFSTLTQMQIIAMLFLEEQKGMKEIHHIFERRWL